MLREERQWVQSVEVREEHEMVTGSGDMIAGTGIAGRWRGLADLSDAERVAQMRPILDEVVALEPAQRTPTIEAMVEAEYGMEDSQLRPFTVSRLRAWLDLAKDNMDGAQELARGYDAAFDKLPASMAMRRSTVVQTAARHDLSSEEVTGLFDLIPSIVRQVPRVTMDTRQQFTSPDQKKKPFWKFW